MVRVRFAPSPTGYLHIGGARTALFNWLFAKRYNGVFVLRIEDTDIERSSKASEETIIASLKWLGITWDEGPDIGGKFGPYRQRERLDIYQRYADMLLKAGKAYYCYCTEEELEERRKHALADKRIPGYDGRCRNLSTEDQIRLNAAGRKPTIRFRVPDDITTVSIHDEIRGEVTFTSDMIKDFVIIRSDGVAAYNFAVVIDDVLMQITHVIRGEDHLSNTPRQVLIYNAFGFKLPCFAHLPLMLGEDGMRLSKRHGATSVEAFRDAGYLPEALVNYLALRGWSEGEGVNKELYSIEELCRCFSLEGVSKSSAIFDMQKLNWMNSMYIKQASVEKIAKLCVPYLKQVGCNGYDLNMIRKMVGLFKDRVDRLSQIAEEINVLLNTNNVVLDKEAKEVIDDNTGNMVITEFVRILQGSIDEYPTEITCKEMINTVGKNLGVKGKMLFMPIRIAITGRMHGPELPAIISILGREECIRRLNRWVIRRKQ
jgi:nondiscriminating glutamyl-tRNA synthetase